ncbi:MAG: hypothetical protein IBX63_09015 [Coriobacteriia bacterium]|nr:hypothetical protein [Coriobacteriia bacterium]
MTGYGQGLGWGMMGSWFGWFVMLLFALLVFVGVILLVIWAARASSGGGQSVAGPTPPLTGHDDAVAIARKRLASGEITPEQFDEIMRALGG